jgi:hypothetical protein
MIRYQKIYPDHDSGIIASIPDFNADAAHRDILIHLSSDAEVELMQSAFLKEIDSEWYPSWNGVIDQFCMAEQISDWKAMRVLLTVDSESSLVALCDLLIVIKSIDDHHKGLEIEIALIRKC